MKLAEESPSVSELLAWQGAGGGALALLPADPTIDFAPDMAQAQGMNVVSLCAHGLVDHIVDERDAASLESREFCARMARAIEYELAAVSAVPVSQIVRTLEVIYVYSDRSTPRGRHRPAQRAVPKRPEKTLTPERAAELVQRAGNGVVLGCDYEINRETVY